MFSAIKDERSKELSQGGDVHVYQVHGGDVYVYQVHGGGKSLNFLIYASLNKTITFSCCVK